MPVRIGFIGCGGIANHHMNSLSKVEGAQMVAFYDTDADRAKQAAEKWGGEAYEDLEAMLDGAGLQAVYICTPPFAHGDLEMAAIERGLHIFLEKPIGLDMAMVRKIEAAIAEKGIICSVGYHWRYMASTEAAKELLDGATISMVLGYWIGGLPGVYWWRQMKLSGGQLVEQTTHIVDLARYFAGEVEKVAGAMALRCLKDVPELDVPDVGAVTLWFESGAVGSICNACHVGYGFRVGIDIFACDRTVSIDGHKLTVRSADGVDEQELPSDPTVAEDTAFVRAVETGDASGIRSDYSDAAKTLAVTLAATLAAEENRVVKVSEVG